MCVRDTSKTPETTQSLQARGGAQVAKPTAGQQQASNQHRRGEAASEQPSAHTTERYPPQEAAPQLSQGNAAVAAEGYEQLRHEDAALLLSVALAAERRRFQEAVPRLAAVAYVPELRRHQEAMAQLLVEEMAEQRRHQEASLLPAAALTVERRHQGAALQLAAVQGAEVRRAEIPAPPLAAAQRMRVPGASRFQ